MTLEVEVANCGTDSEAEMLDEHLCVCVFHVPLHMQADLICLLQNMHSWNPTGTVLSLVVLHA